MFLQLQSILKIEVSPFLSILLNKTKKASGSCNSHSIHPLRPPFIYEFGFGYLPYLRSNAGPGSLLSAWYWSPMKHWTDTYGSWDRFFILFFIYDEEPTDPLSVEHGKWILRWILFCRDLNTLWIRNGTWLKSAFWAFHNFVQTRNDMDLLVKISLLQLN